MGEGTAAVEVEWLERLFGVLGAVGIVSLVAGVDSKVSEATKEIRCLVRQANRSFEESGCHSHTVADTPSSSTSCTPQREEGRVGRTGYPRYRGRNWLSAATRQRGYLLCNFIYNLSNYFSFAH